MPTDILSSQLQMLHSSPGCSKRTLGWESGARALGRQIAILHISRDLPSITRQYKLHYLSRWARSYSMHELWKVKNHSMCWDSDLHPHLPTPLSDYFSFALSSCLHLATRKICTYLSNFIMLRFSITSEWLHACSKQCSVSVYLAICSMHSISLALCCSWFLDSNLAVFSWRQ